MEGETEKRVLGIFFGKTDYAHSMLAVRSANMGGELILRLTELD